MVEVNETDIGHLESRPKRREGSTHKKHGSYKLVDGGIISII
jgi:hypothetical protein